MKQIIQIIFILALFLAASSTSAQAPGTQETLEGKVTDIVEEKNIQVLGNERVAQKLQVYITKGSKKNNTITIDTGAVATSNKQTYKVGDEVVVLHNRSPQGEEIYFISDYIRRTPLFLLWGLFVTLILIIGRWRGLSSLLGMGVSFFIIFYFVIPQILQGKDPVFISIIASIFIIPTTFYLSHGINRKSTVAVIGTLISLVITGILAQIFLTSAKLSGLAQEEVSFIQAMNIGDINVQGLLLAGIIIGVSGILDDTTIAQSSLIEKLHQTDNSLGFTELFKKGMDVGRDHIASLVNTLVPVYAGASLPLMILFVNNPHPFSEIINYEVIANEVVRTLVGSIGLILAVPITTLLSCLMLRQHISRTHS